MNNIQKANSMAIIETYIETNICAECLSNNTIEKRIPNCDKCPLKLAIYEVNSQLGRIENEQFR